MFQKLVKIRDFHRFFMILVVVILALLLVPIVVQAAPMDQESSGITVTPELLVSIAGIVITLIFSYTPGLRTRFAALQTEYQRLIMLGILVGIVAGIVGLSCAGFAADIGLLVTCNRSGVVNLVSALIIAIMANQSTYSLTPQTTDVKRVRTQRRLTGI